MILCEIDCGPVIYQWQGRDCNRMQKAYALDISSRIRFKERSGLAKVLPLLLSI